MDTSNYEADLTLIDFIEKSPDFPDNHTNLNLDISDQSDLEDYGFFPIKRPELIKYYYSQREIRWVPADVDLRTDRHDMDTCDPDTQSFIEGILGFLVPADGLVGENLFKNFQEDTSFWKEARAFYAEQAATEVVHGEMYSLMAQTLIRDPTKLNKIFNSIRTYPSVKRIAEFMKKYMDRKYSLAERIIAFACVEGVLFNSVFAAIYWIKKRNILRGFCKANEFIARDEGIHTKFAVALYLLACKEKKMASAGKDRVYEIINEAVETNTQFIEEILKVDKIGMTVRDLVEYTKCTADALTVSIGHEKLYDAVNPFDWMAVISLPNKTNFFEDKVSEYTQQTESEFVFDENAYF